MAVRQYGDCKQLQQQLQMQQQLQQEMLQLQQQQQQKQQQHQQQQQQQQEQNNFTMSQQYSVEEFLEYTNQDIPDELTLRKHYLDECYNLAIENIQNNIGDNNIWISVDETTDATGQYIANLIVGKLCENEKTQPHLLVSQQLSKTNHASIARFVNSVKDTMAKYK
ncbi:UPF0746 protein DDB_G0281095-like [Pseudomyrmex gracilis]|uniref:UPF0746 protein DDB_G0281095-like n=1 Tax=Pseudomyrmex gracilis TaxID=219809 RepID=UPI000995BA11|nr:UPF0746 protein DDB_G0281095-like [Pseudomyrmex gracilis]